MPNTNPNTITVDLLHQKLDLASQHCLVNYGFYIGATPDNLEELKAAKRTPGIKIFIGSSTGNLLVDKQQALEEIFAQTTLPITAHCEDEQTVQENAQKYAGSDDIATHSKIRDHKAAMIATKRAIDLAVRHNHRFHVLHVSTAAELEVIKENKGLITAEVLPPPSILQCRRLPSTRILGANEPIDQKQRRQRRALARASRRRH